MVELHTMGRRRGRLQNIILLSDIILKATRPDILPEYLDHRVHRGLRHSQYPQDSTRSYEPVTSMSIDGCIMQ